MTQKMKKESCRCHHLFPYPHDISITCKVSSFNNGQQSFKTFESAHHSLFGSASFHVNSLYVNQKTYLHSNKPKKRKKEAAFAAIYVIMCCKCDNSFPCLHFYSIYFHAQTYQIVNIHPVIYTTCLCLHLSWIAKLHASPFLMTAYTIIIITIFFQCLVGSQRLYSNRIYYCNQQLYLERESFLLPWIAEGCPNGTSSQYVFSLWEFNNSLALNERVVAQLAKNSLPQEAEVLFLALTFGVHLL